MYAHKQANGVGVYGRTFNIYSRISHFTKLFKDSSKWIRDIFNSICDILK